MSSWWPWRREEPQPQAEPESWLRLPWRGQSTPAARQPSGLSLQSLQTLSSGVLSSANEAEEALTSSDMLCPSLTIRQRVIGWLCCLGLGLLLEFSGFGRGIKAMAHGEAAAARFAALYSLGNVLALLGTFFLAGPMRQMRRMGREKRWAVSLCFLVSMVLTLTVALLPGHWHGRTLILLVLVLIQWASLIWYTLSYIPFGRRTALAAMRRCWSRCVGE